MKKSILIVFSLIVVISTTAQTKRALFLGNSYTYYNSGVGYWVEKIATSMGDDFEYVEIAPGGYQLNQHCVYQTTLDAIATGNWDYVVLQEQSQMPSFPPEQVETEVYPYAAILCDSIHNANSCTIPLFFMTWGREFGDQTNCPYYPPLCTFEGMQLRLRASYLEMAAENNAQAAPVGMVWKAVRDSLDDALDLYVSDNSHPTLLGTYLTACTFYACMFHKSPEGAMVPDGITENDAHEVQYWVNRIVFDSLDTWLIDTTKVRAKFEAMYLVKQTDEVGGYLQNFSENADSCYWDFGDGSGIWQYPYATDCWEMITHYFPETDYYNICLTAYRGCQVDDTCVLTFIFPQSGAGVPSNQQTLTLFPNPADESFRIVGLKSGQLYRINILDVSGRMVFDGTVLPDDVINTDKLPKGSYVVRVQSTDGMIMLPLLKE